MAKDKLELEDTLKASQLMKNRIKDAIKQFIIEQKIICMEMDVIIEALANLISKNYSSENINVEHAKEIAEDRLPIRLSRGKEVIDPNLADDWDNFITYYSKTSIPYNFELETILKYLVKLDKGVYTDKQLALEFVDEFRDIKNVTNYFILFNISKYAWKRGVSFYRLVNEIAEERDENKKKAFDQEQLKDLVKRGLSEKQVAPLIGVKIAKLLEDNHDLADVMIFPNGNMEGVDSEGNYIFMRESRTENNGTFIILYKVNQENTMRYIINKDTNIAIVTNEDGAYKIKTAKKVATEEYLKLSMKAVNDQIENFITEMSVISFSHDKLREIAEEMIELCNPINEDTNTLKVEEVFDQELAYLKKSYE